MNVEIVKAVLSILVVLGVGICLWLLFCFPLPNGSRDIILVVIGALVATWKDVYGYYFGSSFGSTRKTELLTGSGGTAGKAPIMALMCMAILCALLLMTGCAGQSPEIVAGKSLLAMKDTALNIHEGFRTPCKTGVVPKETCNKVDDLILEAMPAYDAAADAEILYLQSGNSATYLEKKETFTRLIGEMSGLAVKYSVKAEGGGN